MKRIKIVDLRRSSYRRSLSLCALLRVLAVSILFFPRHADSIFGSDEGPPVRYFERVHYNGGHRDHHRLQKRSLENPLTVGFRSHGREFRLNLIPDETVFHPNVHIENSDGQILETFDLPVVGHLEGDENSKVQGILENDGTFDGVIITGNGEEFFVEPSKRHWKDPLLRGESLMYRAEDVVSDSETPCQSHLLHLLRKENGSEVAESDTHLKKPRRRKRWLIDQRKKTCMLFLQADYAFYARFGSEEAAINVMTGHIQRLNEIYRQTDFNLDGTSDDIQFMIKRVKVHTKNRTVDPSYPYDGHFEVIKFLEVFSEGDYDSFCLAYLFTYRDFEGGTLGLAWTGDLKNAGGVCEKKGHFRGGIKSLNTGIITLLNYGKLVSPAVSHVTLAHEIGHNFGSPHDPDNDKACTPGGDDGNFIMFARATAGDRRNNNKFSLCSLKSINPVLSVKARDTYGCFQEPQKAICGNGVVEEGEECDCGWEEDCKETCCFPMRRMSWGGPSVGSPCRLKPNTDCSPSKGPCCTDRCTFTLGQKCRDDNGCRNTAYCDGLRAECPPSLLKPNKTICDKNSHVCFMGECTGSICLAYGLESCQCSQESFDRSTKLCEVCCRVPGEHQCISSFDLNEVPYDLPSVLAKPGTPCKNYTGYCDSYHLCREVDPSGPLATLRKLLSADEGLATIAEWVDNHWYVVIGLILILILLMGLTLRVSRKQRLRKQTVLHSNVEAIQIQRSYLEDAQTGRGTIHPTAVRKKIPFKKKVRERRSKHKQQKAKERKTGGSSEIPKGRSSLWKGRKVKAPSKTPGTFPSKTTESSGGENLPGPSGTQPISSLTSHNHTVKRAIVPNVKRKLEVARGGAKRGEPLKSSKTKLQHPPPPVDGERSRKKSPPKTAASSRRNIQVVYRPPFSVKVEFVPEEGDSKPSKHQGTFSAKKKQVETPPTPSTSQGHSKSSNPAKPNSLLRRRTSKALGGGKYPRNPQSELQILIPKIQEEEDSTTPQLLTS